MTRPEFERELARLRERIRELPEPQRAGMERLARETVERHEEIARQSRQARRAAERLESGLERLRAACEDLARAVEEVRGTIVRSRALQARDFPGVN